jgi:DNA-directed RNA polymerase subunit RPC12/RpoP
VGRLLSDLCADCGKAVIFYRRSKAKEPARSLCPTCSEKNLAGQELAFALVASLAAKRLRQTAKEVGLKGDGWVQGELRSLAKELGDVGHSLTASARTRQRRNGNR